MKPAEVTIKKQYYNTVIAFNNSGVALIDRPYSDLIDLGLMARRSGDKSLLILFETLPDIPDLQAMKMRELKKKLFKQ